MSYAGAFDAQLDLRTVGYLCTADTSGVLSPRSQESIPVGLRAWQIGPQVSGVRDLTTKASQSESAVELN